ncbi:hypothetical protein [Streptomyces syringium]|uniref:hypothetical protein n=1 Tax=Streptomyces syringium TaxID=76729 RepID=UPI0033CDEE15
MPPTHPPGAAATFVCNVPLVFPTPLLLLALAAARMTRRQKAVCTRKLLAATM